MMAALSYFLALVLAVSAAHKAQSPARLTAATARLAGVSPPIGQLLMVLTGAMEAIAALCLILPATMPIGAGVAAGLWASYALALWRHRGEVLDCGCDLVARPAPVGWHHILRAGGLAALALGTFTTTLPAVAGGLGLPPQGLSLMAIPAAAGFFALYLALSEILAIPAPAWRKS